MAMNKKELAAFDAAIAKANMLAALRWTGPVSKDLLPSQVWEEITSGWDFNLYSGQVSEFWSRAGSHGTGTNPQPMRYGSQGSRALFSTKTLALKALRHAIEIEAANKLANIDAQIQRSATV